MTSPLPSCTTPVRAAPPPPAAWWHPWLYLFLQGTSIVASRHLPHHCKAHIHATDRILFTIASIFRRPLLPFGMGSLHYPFACFVAEFYKSQCPCAKSLAFSESWNCSSFSRFCICNIRWPSSPSLIILCLSFVLFPARVQPTNQLLLLLHPFHSSLSLCCRSLYSSLALSDPFLPVVSIIILPI